MFPLVNLKVPISWDAVIMGSRAVGCLGALSCWQLPRQTQFRLCMLSRFSSRVGIFLWDCWGKYTPVEKYVFLTGSEISILLLSWVQTGHWCFPTFWNDCLKCEPPTEVGNPNGEWGSVRLDLCRAMLGSSWLPNTTTLYLPRKSLFSTLLSFLTTGFYSIRCTEVCRY